MFFYCPCCSADLQDLYLDWDRVGDKITCTFCGKDLLIDGEDIPLEDGDSWSCFYLVGDK